MLYDVLLVWPGACNNVAPENIRTSSILNTQNVATPGISVAKRAQHVAPNNVGYVAFKCCDRLAGACKSWANNVGICCVEMLRLLGPCFKS